MVLAILFILCGAFGQILSLFGSHPFLRKKQKKGSVGELKEGDDGSSATRNRANDNYRVIPGSVCYTIGSEDPGSLVPSVFAYDREINDGKGGQKKRYIFNLRSEGFGNKDDDPKYKGKSGIWSNPWCRDSIRERRCMVPVNYFIEGPADRKINKKYVIMRGDKQFFFLGGVWEEVVVKETGEIIRHFALVTTSATAITMAIDHHRCPVILDEEMAVRWLDKDTPRAELDAMMMPADTGAFIAYAVDPSIQKRHVDRADNDPGWIRPMGPHIEPK